MSGLKESYRCALVTGPSSGLGLAFTQMLLDAGITVIGLSRAPELKSAPSHYIPIPVDLSDLDQVRSTLDVVFQTHSEIDLVINNAGFGILDHLQNLSEAQIEGQFAVMLAAPTLIARRAIQSFQSDGRRGCLVNVSSLAVELPLPLMPIYNVCKAGLSALSESLILDASGTSAVYRVIDFRPGDFNTNFAQRMEGRVDWNGADLRAVMDHHHSVAPTVEVATRALGKALLCRRSDTVRVGDFFQSKIAPLGPRLFPKSWLRAIIRFYYRK